MKKYLFGLILFGGIFGVLGIEAAIDKECPGNNWDCLMAEVEQNHNVKMDTKRTMAPFDGLNIMGYIAVEFKNGLYVKTTEILEYKVFENEIGDTPREELEAMATSLNLGSAREVCIYEEQEEIMKDFFLQSGKLEKAGESLTEEQLAYYAEASKKQCQMVSKEGRIIFDDEGFTALNEKLLETSEPLKESAPKQTSLSETGSKGILRSISDWILGLFR